MRHEQLERIVGDIESSCPPSRASSFTCFEVVPRDLPHLVVRRAGRTGRPRRSGSGTPAGSGAPARASLRPATCSTPTVVRQEAERARQLPEVLRPDVRRHDDDGVAQIHALAAAVGQPAFVERLQEQVQQVRAGLLDLVEQDDACTGCPSAGSSGCRRARCRRCRAACRSACRRRPSRPGTRTCRRGPSSSRRRTGTAATAFASSVLPTPVGPRNSSTPSGRSNPSLSGPLFSTSRCATARTAFFWPTTRFCSCALDVLEAIGDVAEHHVLGNLRRVRNHRHDVVGRDLPAAIDFGAHRRGVEPADHLVRQVQVPHVARRHRQRRLDRLVEQAHRVVALEARPQVVEDAPRLLDRRLAAR